MNTDMTPELLHNIPNIWGEGAIFAFSGLDGQTDVASNFVATFAKRPYGLLIHTPQRRCFDIVLPAQGTPQVATGDVLLVDTPSGELAMTFCAWHTIVGHAPEQTRFRLSMENGTAATWHDPCWVSEDTEHGDVIAAIGQGNRFALAYGRTVDEACERAYAGLGAEIDEEFSQRLAIYRSLPTLSDAGHDRLLKKCVSVMKVNTVAPEGFLQQLWSTPDRVPHKDMWLWDSVFHSLAMNHVHADVAWQFLKSMLDAQDDDGMIPHQVRPNGWKSEITQPPILAWGVWENYQHTKDTASLAYALPRLERYLEWDLAHRDSNGNHLLEWAISGEPLCRSGESGLDNSSRFDKAALLDAVDFSVFAARDMSSLASIARALGDEATAAKWEARAHEISQAIHTLLWNDADGFYYDRSMENTLSEIKAVTGFLPLLLDDIPAERIDRLLAHLQDTATFNTAFPIPSLAISEPTWSTDMWRGATWINMNYLIAHGLQQHGKIREASGLIDKTIAYVQKYYEQFGVTFEFYDAKDLVPPTECDRKGPHQEPYNFRRKMDSIRDYHWTAALIACLLFEGQA